MNDKMFTFWSQILLKSEYKTNDRVCYIVLCGGKKFLVSCFDSLLGVLQLSSSILL